MENRKVQRVGKLTLSVSLPNTWAKEHGVKQGDLIAFRPENDGSLRLMLSPLAEKIGASSEVSVPAELCNEPGLLERIIVGNYVLGRDTIRIVAPRRLNSTHISNVRNVLHKLIGLSIIEETSNQLILQCSVDPSKFPIDIVIRRLYVLASTICQEAMQALFEDNSDLAKGAILREDEADMMCFLALRLLLLTQQDRGLAKKISLTDPLHLMGNRHVVSLLEEMADWGENMAESALAMKTHGENISKQLINSISKISELSIKISNGAINSLFSGDISAANRSINDHKKLIELEEDKIINGITNNIRHPESISCLRSLIWGIRRIGEIGAEIAQVAINRALEKSIKYSELAQVK